MRHYIVHVSQRYASGILNLLGILVHLKSYHKLHPSQPIHKLSSLPYSKPQIGQTVASVILRSAISSHNTLPVFFLYPFSFVLLLFSSLLSSSPVLSHFFFSLFPFLLLCFFFSLHFHLSFFTLFFLLCFFFFFPLLSF